MSCIQTKFFGFVVLYLDNDQSACVHNMLVLNNN
jgi:hypothetical protein